MDSTNTVHLLPQFSVATDVDMRLRLMVFLALLGLAGRLKADTITGTVTGVIGGPDTLFGGSSTYSIDTYGLFGTAGTDLVGEPFLLKFAYNTADFVGETAQVYGNSLYYSSSTVVSPAETISFTVNGVTQAYSQSVYSSVGFFAAPMSTGGLFLEDIDTGSGVRGAGIALFSPGGVGFGGSVTVLSNYTSSANFYTSSGARETIQFTPLTPAPEPSSVLLVGTGLLGMAGVINRRSVGKRRS